ncbi:glycosyltransferase family 2 protein [Limnohabitans sp. DCL3]|uniref:glycosyltransferase family 2 protein n=1 Tax=Limnohabitans sp. DCL3 TaxID=3374103 RepID=UPI003A896863
MITLGICIPTYKRPDYLRRCVFSALESAGDSPFRIFIADDSMDETNSAVYEEFYQRNISVVVHRNSDNLGIDDNIQCAVDLCDCDYAWIVGEDDYFLPGGISRVYELLQDAKEAFIFANYAYVGDKEGHLLGQALTELPKRMSSVEFVSCHLWAAGFIGACIIDRHRWSDTSADLYKGTYYTHVGRICEILSRWPTPVLIVAEPCVANRVEGTDTFTWKRDSYGVFFGFRAMCAAVSVHCPPLKVAVLKAAQVMADRYGWLTLRLAIRLRSEMGYDLNQYQRYLAPEITNQFKRMAFLIISIAPPWIFQPIVTVYRRLIRGLID